ARRVPPHPPRHEHGEDAVAARHRAADRLAIVRRAREEGDAPLEFVELAHALGAADADDLVAAFEGVSNHVPSELARRADDTDPPTGLMRDMGFHGLPP